MAPTASAIKSLGSISLQDQINATLSPVVPAGSTIPVTQPWQISATFDGSGTFSEPLPTATTAIVVGPTGTLGLTGSLSEAVTPPGSTLTTLLNSSVAASVVAGQRRTRRLRQQRPYCQHQRQHQHQPHRPHQHRTHCLQLDLANSAKSRHAGFHRSLDRKHGQQMTEVGVSPLQRKTRSKCEKSASSESGLLRLSWGCMPSDFLFSNFAP